MGFMRFFSLGWVNRTVELTDGKVGRVISATPRTDYVRLCVDFGDKYEYVSSQDVWRFVR